MTKIQLIARLAIVEAQNAALTERLVHAKEAYRAIVRERDGLLVAQRPSRRAADEPRVVNMRGGVFTKRVDWVHGRKVATYSPIATNEHPQAH